jgi:nucleoside-diphosphate-sugar epimerase
MAMKIVVTGHAGYIGPVMVPTLRAAGHDVVGLDTFLFEGCTLGPVGPEVPSMRKDIRDVRAADLEGFDAVVHLAALSNDPLGNVNRESTYEVNHRATVHVATEAKRAGVRRFVFASSCSLYGAAEGDVMLDENAAFNPVTPYGESKIRSEQDLLQLADDRFSPSFMRCATAYGFSPHLRADIVVNNLVGYALTKGEVLIKSDGTPWRPLVHIEDISRAFLAVLEAPREKVHGQAFNVGADEENYQIRDVANIVQEVVPGSRVVYAPGGSPDIRNYRVSFAKIHSTLGYTTRWNVRRGAEELYRGYREAGLTFEDFQNKFVRLARLRALQEQGRLDANLRWR